MSNLLVDLEAYLISNSLATADGEDIFRDFTPPTPDNIIIISEYAGIPGPSCSTRSVQVKARNISNALAKQKAWDIYNIFDSVEEKVLYITDTRWIVYNLRQTPFKAEHNDSTTTWCFNIGIVTYNDV